MEAVGAKDGCLCEVADSEGSVLRGANQVGGFSRRGRRNSVTSTGELRSEGEEEDVSRAGTRVGVGETRPGSFDGTWSVSSGRARQPYRKVQEKDPAPGQITGTGRGSGIGNEENEEIEEDEEEEEVEEDGVYCLRFDDGMNPLDFTENDASGLQPYEQFERLEYEALAEKKRKALSQCQPEGLAKKARLEDNSQTIFDEIMETMNHRGRRRSRKHKKSGRRKGLKNKLSPEVTRKLGEANLHYAHGHYEEAIFILKEVVRLAPNLPDAYHTFGLVYNAFGDKKRALNFYMLAAHLTPKDSSLWKLLVAWSIEQGNPGQARYCLSKAITADPEDISLRFHRASLYVELGEYQKAAESYEQISQLFPENVEALKTGAKLYKECGQIERSISILEDYIKDHPTKADLNIIDMLAAVCMENNAHSQALQHIEHAQLLYCSGKDLPLYLTINAGICHVHLGNIEKAEALFSVLQQETNDLAGLVSEVADSFMSLELYDFALKYYLMLVGNPGRGNGFLHLKIAQCYLALKKRVQAIPFFYKALDVLQDNTDARLTLATLLLEEAKEDEAILLLSPPKSLESTVDRNSDEFQPWWLDGKVKLKLAHIYRSKGMLDEFVDAIFPSVQESLFIETLKQKVRVKKRLSKSVLSERVKILDDHQSDNVFHGFRPIASTFDLSKASRAKKLLQKKATRKEERKAAAMAAGMDWYSDTSDDESPEQKLREPPLPNLLKDEEHHRLILDLCKALASSQKYWEALDIINLTLRLTYNIMPIEKKEELRSLGAQIAYNITDPKRGFDYVKYIVHQHPYSIAAWNCYYKVISRLENRFSKHSKLLHSMRVRYKDSVPPIVIFGHQFTMISQHQIAAKEYLEAYKLMPENPLINLCAGTALINIALGLRVQNKHQCLAQGLAFLYNNLRLCENSQEALYNIARAYHHVGLVSLAVTYYEKVLATHERDLPIPKLPYENTDLGEKKKPGYCDLRREAAYNLHLIYKKSGALDLARQILKDHCTI